MVYSQVGAARQNFAFSVLCSLFFCDLAGMKTVFSFFCMACFLPALAQGPDRLYLGTYTGNGSTGIYAAQFNTATGHLVLLDSAKVSNPSYLCLSPDGRRLYAISEDAGAQGGMVHAYAVEGPGGALRLLNSMPAGGDHPCFISINAAGTHVAVANYSGGSVAVFALDAKGALASMVQLVRHRGSGPHAQRQAAPHVHQAVFHPAGRYLLVADLGTDEVVAYPFSATAAMPLDTARALRIKPNPGGGPRHLAVAKRGNRVYVMEELTGTVSVLRFGKKGFAHLQTIACDTISPNPGSADIHLSPDGRFLYGSNRADAHTLVTYAVAPRSGRLRTLATTPVEGRGPRNFALHPSGKWVVVANQLTGNVVVFARDAATGLPGAPVAHIKLPSPVCIAFVPPTAVQ